MSLWHTVRLKNRFDSSKAFFIIIRLYTSSRYKLLSYKLKIHSFYRIKRKRKIKFWLENFIVISRF